MDIGCPQTLKPFTVLVIRFFLLYVAGLKDPGFVRGENHGEHGALAYNGLTSRTVYWMFYA